MSDRKQSPFRSPLAGSMLGFVQDLGTWWRAKGYEYDVPTSPCGSGHLDTQVTCMAPGSWHLMPPVKDYKGHPGWVNDRNADGLNIKKLTAKLGQIGTAEPRFAQAFMGLERIVTVGTLLWLAELGSGTDLPQWRGGMHYTLGRDLGMTLGQTATSGTLRIMGIDMRRRVILFWQDPMFPLCFTEASLRAFFRHFGFTTKFERVDALCRA